MYKIIIADDELIVREGIVNSVDFNSLGFELVAVCRDGREAIEAVRNHKPNVIITDINMPYADGLEIAKFASEMLPQPKTVLLTGFNEFEFAQKAVKLKVYEYILKPITAKSLLMLLEKLKQELDQENNRLKAYAELQRNLHRSQEIVREHFLNQITTSKDLSVDIKKLSELNLNIGINDTITVLIVNIDNIESVKAQFNMTSDLLNYAVSNICSDLIDGNGDVFKNKKLKTVIIANQNINIETLAINIKNTISKTLGFYVSVFIGDSVNSINEIADAYNSAITALEYKHLFEENSIVHVRQISENQNLLDFYEQNFNNKLIEAIKTVNSLKVDECIKTMLEHFKRYYLSYEQINFFISNLVAEIVREVNNLNIYGDNKFKAAEIFVLDDSVDFDDLFSYLIKLSNKAISYIESLKGGFNKIQTERAIAFINEHASDSTLSLLDVCNHLSISKSHFSNLFKSETGLTFVEYLTKIRIEKAKNLLANTDLKTYEVAEKVGINDPQYFSVIFKKHAKMSPKEFQKAHEK